LERISNSKVTKLFVTDTINIEGIDKESKIQVITSAELFAEAIRRAFNNESISSLFHIDKG